MPQSDKKPVFISVPPTTPRESYAFPHGFAGGMNTSANADAIAPNETPSVCNMELQYGIWAKRDGFRLEHRLGFGPVQGMHVYRQEGKPPKTLIVSGRRLFIFE